MCPTGYTINHLPYRLIINWGEEALESVRVVAVGVPKIHYLSGCGTSEKHTSPPSRRSCCETKLFIKGIEKHGVNLRTNLHRLSSGQVILLVRHYSGGIFDEAPLSFPRYCSINCLSRGLKKGSLFRAALEYQKLRDKG